MTLQVQGSLDRPRVRRVATAFVVVAFLLTVALALAGLTGNGDDSEAPVAPSRPLLVRHADGSTELIMIVDQTGLIVGSVQDAAGTPLAGIRVGLTGIPNVVETSALGHFRFDTLAPQTYEIRAEGAGYQAAEAKIEIHAGDVAQVRITMLDVDAVPDESSAEGNPLAPVGLAGGQGAQIPTVEVPTWSLYFIGLVVLAVAGTLVFLRLQNPARMVARGRAALAQGSTAQSELLARRVLARQPGNSDAWILLGASMIKRGAYAEAVRLLERASAYYDPQVAGVAFLITLAYRRMGRADAARPWLHLVARDAAYWSALDQDPDGVLASWLHNGAMRAPIDPAYG